MIKHYGSLNKVPGNGEVIQQLKYDMYGTRSYTIDQAELILDRITDNLIEAMTEATKHEHVRVIIQVIED